MDIAEDIQTILASNNNPAKVVCLQAMLNQPADNLPPNFIFLLETLCLDDDSAVRFWSKKCLAFYQQSQKQQVFEIIQSEEIPLDVLFKKMSENSSRYVVMDLLQKICDMHKATAFKSLAAYLKTCKDVVIISFLVKKLGFTYPTEETLAIITPYLKHSDERVVANCIEALGNLKYPKSIALINQMLCHENHRIKANAASALQGKDPEVTKTVIRWMLQSKDKPHFVIAACKAIELSKFNDFLPELTNLITDPIICSSALTSIVAIGDDSALGYLEAAAETADVALKKKIEEKIEEIQHNKKTTCVENSFTNTLQEGKVACNLLGKAVLSRLQQITQDVKESKIYEKIAKMAQEKQTNSIRKPKETLAEKSLTLAEENIDQSSSSSYKLLDDSYPILESQIDTKENQKIDLFFELAIELGFITKKDCELILEQKKNYESRGLRKELDAYFLESNLLTKEQIAKILDMRSEILSVDDNTEIMQCVELKTEVYEKRLANEIEKPQSVIEEIVKTTKCRIPKSGHCTNKCLFSIMICSLVGLFIGLLVGGWFCSIINYNIIYIFIWFAAILGCDIGNVIGGYCRNNIKYAVALLPLALASLTLSAIVVEKDYLGAFLYIITPVLAFWHFYDSSYCENCQSAFIEKDFFSSETSSPHKVLTFLRKKLFPIHKTEVLKATENFPLYKNQKKLQISGEICPNCQKGVVNLSLQLTNKTLLIYSDFWSGLEISQAFGLGRSEKNKPVSDEVVNNGSLHG